MGLLLLLLWNYSNCPSHSLCSHPHFEHLNPAPAVIDTQCHGTSLSQLWMEDGLSSDIASGVETPLTLLTTVYVCIVAPWSLFVSHRCPLFPSNHCKHNGYCISSQQRVALSSSPWSQCFITISRLPGDACDRWRKRAGQELVGAELWGVGTSRRASTYGWNQRREAYFTVAIPCRQHCTSLVGTGIFLVVEYRIRSSKCFRSGSLGFAKP